MINKPMIGVAAVVVLAAAGTWYALHGRGESLPSVPIAAPVAETAAVEEPVAIRHPVPAPADGTQAKTPLPPLSDSDPGLREALTAAAGDSVAAQFLTPESIVRHLVVTIDNLPRQKIPLDRRPTVAVPGAFIADGDELHATLDAQNYARYQPMVDALSKLDMQKVSAVYLRFYPLFQQAYEGLGYPSGYFNDRLVQVIDVLLATPRPTQPVELLRPNVMYTFADPALEARPAGQKVLIRMGPDNAAAVKAKLMELRAIVTASAPRH